MSRPVGSSDRGVATWVTLCCALAAVLGAFLVVTGLIRLADGSPGTGGPVGRLVIGVLLLAAAGMVVVVARRGRPLHSAADSSASDRAEAHAETVSCPACGATNPPSAQHCHRCGRALR